MRPTVLDIARIKQMAEGKRQQCREALQEILPRVGLRWSGYRKVYRQVCKRLVARMAEIRLNGWTEYVERIENDTRERERFRFLARITISRFYRDRAVFNVLRWQVLPELAGRGHAVRVWSAGCASGEEPYTLSAIRELRLRSGFPRLSMTILATDIDEHLLQRARRGLYHSGSLRELPDKWVRLGFDQVAEDQWRARAPLRRQLHFARHDLLQGVVPGPWHVICCRYLAFLYFDRQNQSALLSSFEKVLSPGGFLVLGNRDRFPPNREGWKQPFGKLPIWQRVTN